MLLQEIIKETENILCIQLKADVVIYGSSAVGGGCINDAHRIDTSAGRFFVKYNHSGRYPGMFAAEAKGLSILRASNTVNVPFVLGYGEAGQYSVLVLDFINSAAMTDNFWQEFGAGLAAMHQTAPKNHSYTGSCDVAETTSTGASEGVNPDKHGFAQKGFGLDHDNYIGSLPQNNRWHHSWIDFFVNERLETQLRLAVDTGRVAPEFISMFQKLYKHLHDFFPNEPPALLHGDLWSGNYMVGSTGKATLVDPAVYYGHRYMDLGMSKLFGGFSSAFYEAYNDAYSLEASWNDSMDIANLYPLMVHVNLFGGGYRESVKSIIRRF